MDKYQVIYADPPWSYSNKNTGGSMDSGAKAKYSTMTFDEIKNMPIKDIAAKDSVLFMWVTVPLLPECLEILPAWGYKYKTILTWRKIMSLGMGFWFRGQCEHLVLGVRGKVKAFRMQKPNFHQCKVGKHSQKPHHFRELISMAVENSFDNPKKLELFARERNDLFPNYEYEGWDLFGNQHSESIKLPIGIK